MSGKQDILSMAKEKAEELFSKGRYQEAFTTYEKIKTHGARDPRIFLRMGDIQRKLENPKSAIEYYIQAEEGFAKLGFLVKAIAVCKMVSGIDPSFPGVQERLAKYRGAPENNTAPSGTAKGKASKLPRTPLFSDFGDTEFLEVVKKVRSRELGQGEYLFNEGDSGDSIYIIAEGSVDIIGNSKQGSQKRLAGLGEGEIFGEFGFFLNSKRTTGVKACERTTVLELTKADLEELISRHPGIERVLFDFYKKRVVDRLMALSEVFSPLSVEDRGAVLEKVSLERSGSGTDIVTEGDRGETMYLVKKGAVKAWVKDKTGDKKTIAELMEGDFFGEIALATNRPRMATITALTDVELLAFKRALIKDILGKYPQVKGVLEKIIKERALDIIKAREGRGVLV